MFSEKEENVVVVGAVDRGENCRYPRSAQQTASTGDVGRKAAEIGRLCAVAAPRPIVRAFSPAVAWLSAGCPELFPRVVHRLCVQIVLRETICDG